MAQVATDAKLDSAPKSTLTLLPDWIKEEEEEKAKAAAERRPGEPVKKKSKKEVGRVGATTKVIGRPSTNNPLVIEDPQSPPPPPQVDLAGKNWIGLLLEYRNAHPSTTGPDYQESSPGQNLFSCCVTIGEHAEPFGNRNVTLTRKKDAKQYAAKLAIEWLIANRHMPADGSVSFPKLRPQQPTANRAANPAVFIAFDDNDNNDKGPSFGQRVAELCTKLAMSPPTYVITAHKDFQAMYSGHATFENSPEILGKVGEFENVHSKKKAKEVCAEKVLNFLEDIAWHRAERAKGKVEEKLPDQESWASLLD